MPTDSLPCAFGTRRRHGAAARSVTARGEAQTVHVSWHTSNGGGTGSLSTVSLRCSSSSNGSSVASAIIVFGTGRDLAAIYSRDDLIEMSPDIL